MSHRTARIVSESLCQHVAAHGGVLAVQTAPIVN